MVAHPVLCQRMQMGHQKGEEIFFSRVEPLSDTVRFAFYAGSPLDNVADIIAGLHGRVIDMSHTMKVARSRDWPVAE